MIEIKLENQKNGKIKNSYNLPIIAEKTNNHFFVTINEKKYGPFARLFLAKQDNGDSIIIGYFPKESQVIRITKKGINVSKRCITSNSQLKEYDSPSKKSNIQLLGVINNYSIYFSDNQFFAINNEDENKNFDNCFKFDDFEDLVEYYREQNISLNSTKISSMALKVKRIFVNFDEIYNYVESLTINDLDEELQLDIVMERNIFKKFFSMAKKACSKTPNSQEDITNLLNSGYVELEYRSLEKLKQLFTEQYNKLNELVNNKSSNLKEDCLVSLKEKDNLNFDNLYKIIDEIRITDLNDTARKEISAKRPLVTSIFSSVISSSIDKLAKQGIHIREEYKMPKNLKTIYPDEYEVLWQLIDKRLPTFYNEYFEYQKERFSKLIKKQ